MPFNSKYSRFDNKRLHSIPNAPSVVVAMISETREGGREPVCEVCGQPIKHPSQYWYCGASWLKRKKGVRHPDGVYWHKECLS